MKTSIIALTFAAFTASGAALATESATPPTVAQTEQSGSNHVGASPKTRADARHELVRAQQDGQLASLRTLYRGS
ncbi:hypothetical protein OKW43_000823 [Paraburkholderia sp. WC7.3g]|uniref:DUF4148 domain-containing protein n=1 Tax=Paraburkholderia podalyriae TaxID=1938811 RepID=A0ABR7PJI8_9BURK|nr:DUF4148 domain-containing protein [Paraburkholderia podalyriae]MBC8746331.1 DUF4148 domain-containing protein [Paraburkholderia podalyriae]